MQHYPKLYKLSFSNLGSVTKYNNKLIFSACWERFFISGIFSDFSI